MHLTCAEAYKENKPIPADLNVYVIGERYGALAWITMYAESMSEETEEAIGG